MKKNSLLLWILIPVSCMTNYVVYAEPLDPLDPGVVVEEPTPIETDLVVEEPTPIETDLIEPDPWEGPDPTIPEEESLEAEELWEPEEGVINTDVTEESTEEIVDAGATEESTAEEEVVDAGATEELIDSQELLDSIGIGGIQSALIGGTQSTILPSTSTDNQNDSLISNPNVTSNQNFSTETDPDQPVMGNTTASNLTVHTDNQNDSSISNPIATSNQDSSTETDPDQPVMGNTTASNLTVHTDNQNNSSPSSTIATSNQNSSTEAASNTTASNLTINPNENSTQTSSSNQTELFTRSSSTNNSNTANFNLNQSNLSSSTSTQSRSKVSTSTSTLPKSVTPVKENELMVTIPQNDSSTSKNVSTTNNTLNSSIVQDDAIITTPQNSSTTVNENTANHSALSKGDLSTTSKLSSVFSSAAQPKETPNEDNNEANEDEEQLITPKSSPTIKTNENATIQVWSDPVVIMADNSVIPNTFSVDTQIGPYQVFLINIGKGYSKPAIVEHLSNSQVFIKESLLTYVPNPGFVGIDTFSYQVIDPEGNKVVRQVRVKVTAKDELVPVKNCQLYFVNDASDSDSQLLTVAPTSKIAIKLGPEYYTFDIEGMAIHPTNGLLYASSGKGQQNIFDGYLYRVNPETGGVTIIGDTGFSETSSLAFRHDGTLWSWSRKGSKDKSKAAGLIQIDPTTAQSQLIFPSTVNIEGLAWDDKGKILYGTEETRLWAFDGKELQQQCSNFSSEIESLETSVNGMLLIGTDEYSGNAVHLYDPAICEEVIGNSFAIPSITGDFDIESIAWSLECQAAITKTTRSDKDSNLAIVDNKKKTRNSKKPVTTCPNDTMEPCSALDPEEVKRFFTDNLKADFVQLEADGLVFVSLNGQLHYGFFSHSLSTKQVNQLKLSPVYEVTCEREDRSVAQLKLGLTEDVDNEGHDDFVMTYCDGQAQMLFYLGIKEKDLEIKKSNSNPKKD